MPSQIMENWTYQRECLDLFSTHYSTGEKIPSELVEQVTKSANFQEGLSTLRQLQFALIDMAWHWQCQDVMAIDSVEEFEKKAKAKATIMPEVAGLTRSTSFGHIFAGKYSAGCYSYKWAEVLDADAFELFKKEGIFNPAIGAKFRSTILEKGGSEHPLKLYKNFRGQEASIDALLKRVGL